MVSGFESSLSKFEKIGVRQYMFDMLTECAECNRIKAVAGTCCVVNGSTVDPVKVIVQFERNYCLCVTVSIPSPSILVMDIDIIRKLGVDGH